MPLKRRKAAKASVASTAMTMEKPRPVGIFHTGKLVLERRHGGTRLASDIHMEEKHSRGLIRGWLQRSKKVGNRNATERSNTIKIELWILRNYSRLCGVVTRV
jgi:hypothetical protein